MTGPRNAICVLVLLLGVDRRQAGAQTDAQCQAYYHRITTTTRIIPKPCQVVAAYIATSADTILAEEAVFLKPDRSANVASIFSQRDLQSRQTQQASTAGGGAQGHALPSVQPAGVAAGTLALVGTKKGDDAIAALSVNPAVLFLADAASQQLAQLSRIADVSVLIPVSTVETASTSPSTDAKLKYVGARMRLNLLGKSSGDQVWEGAVALIKKWVSNKALDQARLEALLAKAPDFEKCGDGILHNKTADIATGCGTPFALTTDAKAVELLKTELRKVRAAADAQYFGADMRADFGDPSLGAVPNASGRYWSAGLAGGRRFGGAEQTGPNYGLRARAGLRYAKLDSIADAEFAGEGGVGIEMAHGIDDQEINASAALEFRYGNAPANTTDRFQTNFVMIRGSLLLPIFGGNGVSINLGIPVAGKASPIMSVNFNWGLLLSDALKR